MSTRAVARELNVNFSTISRLQRRFREFGSTSNRPHNRRPHVTTPVWDQPPGQLLQQSVCITKEFLHKLSKTISGKLICMLVILIGVSTWLQFVVVTDLSGQMLTFDGVWHFGEVFSSRMNPGFHWTGQMADSVYGIVWVSGLLKSMLWIEWPMVVVGLWYGQAYVMDNEHRCILLMVFWMHRDTMTRSWGPLLCHSSMTITSCCSMIMHSPMLQGHNSWKLKTSQFLLAWPAYSPDMSPIEHVWDALDRRIRQRVPVPANIQQLYTAFEEEWTNIPQATINNLINSMRRRCVALRKANGGHTRYWLVFGLPQYSKTAHFRVAFYCGQPKAHLCNNHAV